MRQKFHRLVITHAGQEVRTTRTQGRTAGWHITKVGFNPVGCKNQNFLKHPQEAYDYISTHIKEIKYLEIKHSKKYL